MIDGDDMNRRVENGELERFRSAVEAVKLFLEEQEPAPSPNDLIITGIKDHDDLWLFQWNNGWPLLGMGHFEYPGCDSIVVFKADGCLIQLPRIYGWVDGAFDDALEAVRNSWRAQQQND